MNNSRSLLKIWPVVFGCLNTRVVHLELNRTYGTGALLLSITAFTSTRGLCRRVKLEARPRGGPLGLPYISKNLETFEMATQRLVLLHPHEAEIITKDDLSFNQQNQDLENEAAEDEEDELPDLA